MSQNKSNNFQQINIKNNSSPTTWKKAWMESHGPETFTEHLYLFLKGFCMGTADIIPGVSGGTIAFITGIYDSLLSAISSINFKLFLQIIRLNFKKALSQFHLRFLLTLFLGIAIAIISTANLMYFLLNEYPVQIWSMFFGLITASIILLITSIKINFSNFSILILGIIISYNIIGIVPLNTPNDSWFIFFCGLIAVCAMILPGLSGSFLLLILGKYEFITAALMNPFLIQNLEIILIFLIGCILGVIFFSRLLKYCMVLWRNYTLAILTGIMIGSMRKVWPWKITLESQIIRGKEYVLREINVFPEVNYDLVMSLFLMCVGFTLVLILNKLSKFNSKNYSDSSK